MTGNEKDWADLIVLFGRRQYQHAKDGLSRPHRRSSVARKSFRERVMNLKTFQRVHHD